MYRQGEAVPASVEKTAAAEGRGDPERRNMTLAQFEAGTSSIPTQSRDECRIGHRADRHRRRSARNVHPARRRLRRSQRRSAARLPDRCLRANPGSLRREAEIHRPPRRAGKLAGRSAESADRAGDGEPDLASTISAAASSARRAISAHGRTSDASGTARLAGRRVCARRLEHQADAPADHDFATPISSLSTLPRSAAEAIRTTSCSGGSRAIAWKAKRFAIRRSGRGGVAERPRWAAPASSRAARRRCEPRGGWKVTEQANPSAIARSVYIFVRRNTRYPMLEAFDMPDTHESCARRKHHHTATAGAGDAEQRVWSANGRRPSPGGC